MSEAVNKGQETPIVSAKKYMEETKHFERKITPRFSSPHKENQNASN